MIQKCLNQQQSASAPHRATSAMPRPSPHHCRTRHRTSAALAIAPLHCPIRRSSAASQAGARGEISKQYCGTVNKQRNSQAEVCEEISKRYRPSCKHPDSPHIIHWHTTRCKTAHSGLRNGPFCNMKWAVLQCEMGRIASPYHITARARTDRQV